MMNQDLVLFLLGQSAVIVGAVVVSFINTKIAIAKLQIISGNNTERLKDLKGDHKNLADKVDGISRHVAKFEQYMEEAK